MPAAVGFAIAGFVGISVGTVGATIIGSVAIGIVAIGGQLLLNKLLGKQPSLKPSQAQQEVRLTIAPRRRSYGRVRVSGSIWFLDTSASGDQLYTGLTLNHGRIAAVVGFHIDENDIEINESTGVIQTSPYTFDATNRILYRLGQPAETAYGDLATVFGLPNMRGDGVATMLARMKDRTTAELQMSTFPGGLPEYRVTIDATVCWDPRDPAQDRLDPSTWEFSENVVVVVLNYLLDRDGFGLPWARIEPNIVTWIDEANICDSPVELVNGGTSALYRIASTFELTERPVDVLGRMLSVGDARLWQRRDGSLGITVGTFREPGVTIPSQYIVAWDIERGQDPLTRVSGIRASYMSPDHDYREREAESWPDGPTVASLSEDRVTNLDLTWVPSRSQARRLMKREFIRQTAGWRGQITTNLYGLKAADSRFVRVIVDDIQGLQDPGLTFEVLSFTIDPENLHCTLDIANIDASIDEWDPSEEGTEQGFGTFGFLESFAKTGTALDPLGEAGAEIGYTVLVFGAASSLASTPAGYELVTSAGPTSSLAIACWCKVIDGSEGSATFLGASGALLCFVFNGAQQPKFRDKGQQVTTSTPGKQNKPERGTPYAAFGFAACLANQADTDWLVTANIPNPSDADDLIEPDEELLHSTGSSLSGLVKMVLYGSEENATDVFCIMEDEGTNGLLSFIMEPGG